MSLCSLAAKVIPATAIKPFDIYGIVSIRYRSKLVDQVAIVKRPIRVYQVDCLVDRQST